MLQLVLEGKPVQKGQWVKDFRGDWWEVKGWQEPHKPSSTGRIYVRKRGSEWNREFFPSVVDAKWVEVES